MDGGHIQVPHDLQVLMTQKRMYQENIGLKKRAQTAE